MTLDISVLIPHNWPLLEILATASTEQNCIGQWRPSKAISRRTATPKSVPSCAWMGNMARELSSLTWQDWRMSCAAKTINCTHPAPAGKSRVGVPCAGVVYELFLTHLSQDAFTASDIVALYLHRGAFENTLADEDLEKDPDRWCSHAAFGQETWQIISQWVWNLRLELGHQLAPEAVRTTEFAPALPPAQQEAPNSPSPSQGYRSAEVALPWKAGRFSGRDFALQPDGTLRCPAGQSLVAHERRTEADGSLRVVYAASIRSCRPCPLREQCQWHGRAATKPRRVSVLLHPLLVGSAPLLWRDWSRRLHRRACMQLPGLY